MKSPSKSSPKAAAKKPAKPNANSKQKPISPPALRREYKQTARHEEARAKREQADAKYHREQAAKDEAAAKAAEAAGNTAAARADMAAARHELRRARHDAALARRNQVKAKRNEAKARHVGLASPGARSGGWILGNNDRHETCAAVAVANSLLLSSGLLASDEEVWDLHLRGGGSVLGALEAAAEYGLGGCRLAGLAPAEIHERDEQRCHQYPLFENFKRAGELHRLRPGQLNVLDDIPVALLDDDAPVPARPVDGHGGLVGWGDPALVLVHPLIVDLDLTEAQQDQGTWDAELSPAWGPHAALFTGDSVVTWGREIAVTQAFLASQVTGAWLVEWSDAR